MKKFLTVICLVILAACSKEPSAQEKAAKELYKYNYWMIRAPFDFAYKNIKAKAEMVKPNKEVCGYDLTMKIASGMEDAKKTLEESETNIAALIAANVPQKEIEEANDYYKNTQLGVYISSQKGFLEMGKALESSQYKPELEQIFAANPNATSEQKFNVLVAYALKLLPPEETEKYKTFNASPIWKKLSDLGPKINEAIQPFIKKSSEMAKISQEIVAACPSPQAQAAAKASLPTEPKAATKAEEPAAPAAETPAEQPTK